MTNDMKRDEIVAGRRLSVVKIQVSSDVCATVHIKYTCYSTVFPKEFVTFQSFPLEI